MDSYLKGLSSRDLDIGLKRKTEEVDIVSIKNMLKESKVCDIPADKGNGGSVCRTVQIKNGKLRSWNGCEMADGRSLSGNKGKTSICESLSPLKGISILNQARLLRHVHEELSEHPSYPLFKSFVESPDLKRVLPLFPMSFKNDAENYVRVRVDDSQIRLILRGFIYNNYLFVDAIYVFDYEKDDYSNLKIRIRDQSIVFVEDNEFIKSMFYESTFLEDFKTTAVKFERQGVPSGEVKDYLDKFKKMRDVRIKGPDEKNIDNWAKKSFDEFKDFVDTKEQEVTKTQKTKTEKIEGAELVGENEEWQVYRIYTHKAAQIYGKGTKWCITDPSKGYWDWHNLHSNLYFFISKTRSKRNPLYKVAFQDSAIKGEVYWDATDLKTKKPENIPPFKRDKVVEKVNIEGKIYTLAEFANLKGLKVVGDLDLSGTNVAKLPEGLSVGGYLNLEGTKVTELPDGLSVGSSLTLTNTKVTKLPDGLSVGMDLDLSGTSITKIPSDAKIGGEIYGLNQESKNEFIKSMCYESCIKKGDGTSLLKSPLSLTASVEESNAGGMA